ncbi:hypothetical protein F5Y18DRAFT_369276 [Xylariaceae sp. FL1019]|nr:hypothetical protein F5Y18DRAFT_369276 [Xylariaceae sp. FL1019]
MPQADRTMPGSTQDGSSRQTSSFVSISSTSESPAATAYTRGNGERPVPNISSIAAAPEIRANMELDFHTAPEPPNRWNPETADPYATVCRHPTANFQQKREQVNKYRVITIKIFRLLQTSTCLTLIVLGAEALTTWISPSKSPAYLFRLYVYVGAVTLITLCFCSWIWSSDERSFRGRLTALGDMFLAILWLVSFAAFGSLRDNFESEVEPYSEDCYRRLHVIIFGLLGTIWALVTLCVLVHFFDVFAYVFRRDENQFEDKEFGPWVGRGCKAMMICCRRRRTARSDQQTA